jgi:Icc-related predicted phosphoesterase
MLLCMKLHILSDLHTEFASFVPPDTYADVVILAGDIGVGLRGIEWAAGQFPKVPVIYVPGNHEFYGHDIVLIEELVKQSPPNIHVLNNDKAMIDGVRFVGSTLWTDFKLHGEGEAWFSRQRAKRSIEDFAAIKNCGRPFTPEASVDLHDESRAWIASMLGDHFDGPTVVVTHHLPASMSVAKRYANDPLNPAFASRLEDLIEKYRPELWIHGHTHVPCDYELFDTRIVCNPRGYPGEICEPAFRRDLVIRV